MPRGLGRWGSRPVNSQGAGRERCQEARSAVHRRGDSRVERSVRPFPGALRSHMRSLALAVTCSRTTALTRRPAAYGGHQEDAVSRSPRRREETLACREAQHVGEW